MVQPDHECDFITNIVGSIYKNVLKIGFFRTGFLGGGKAWGLWGVLSRGWRTACLADFPPGDFRKKTKKSRPVKPGQPAKK
jgi:hypothetical protein